MKMGKIAIGFLFLFTTGCSDNSGMKAQLAAMQAQMAAQSQITAQQLQNAHNQTKLNCYANATDINSKALCDKL
ncbi:MAG: hypothetical protein ACXVB9_09075 [Bdellovibrionota bacterium]